MNQKHVQHECQYLKFISLSLDIVNIDIPVVQTHCEGHWVELGEVQGGNLYWSSKHKIIISVTLCNNEGWKHVSRNILNNWNIKRGKWERP